MNLSFELRVNLNSTGEKVLIDQGEYTVHVTEEHVVFTLYNFEWNDLFDDSGSGNLFWMCEDRFNSDISVDQSEYVSVMIEYIRFRWRFRLENSLRLKTRWIRIIRWLLFKKKKRIINIIIILKCRISYFCPNKKIVVHRGNSSFEFAWVEEHYYLENIRLAFQSNNMSFGYILNFASSNKIMLPDWEKLLFQTTDPKQSIE